MKTKIIITIVISLFLFSCGSSNRQFKKGNFDNAIAISVKKLRKDPSKADEISILQKSYINANTKDNERIKFLKLEGKPDVWEEIFNLYNNLKSRQSIVKTVLPLKINDKVVSFNIVDYDNEILDAKKKAAEYFYVHATKLLNNNNIYDAREAYEEFLHVKDYYSTYKDVDKMIELSKEKGTVKTFIETANKTHFRLPQQFVNDLAPKDLTQINSKWVQYYRDNNFVFNYKVTVSLNSVMVSPELLKEEIFKETKTIRDGWKYKLDSHGNVMKDSLGNDIKEPKYIDIFCNVIKTIQRREISLFSEITYKNLSDNRIIKNIPIKTDWFIENSFAIANGDLRAVSKSTEELLNRKPILMPNDIDMIFNATDILRNVVRTELINNKYVIK